MLFPSAVSSYDELWLSLIKPIFILLNLNLWQALSAFLFGACSSLCSACIIYFHTLLYDNAARESSEGSTVFFRQSLSQAILRFSGKTNEAEILSIA